MKKLVMLALAVLGTTAMVSAQTTPTSTAPIKEAKAPKKHKKAEKKVEKEETVKSETLKAKK